MGKVIQPMYQAMAETRSGGVIPVGPKWSEPGAALAIVDMLKRKISSGARELGNPHVVRTVSQQ